MAERKRRRKTDPVSQRRLNARMRTKLVGLFAIVVLAFVFLAIRITIINAKDGNTYKKKVLTQSQQQYSSKTLPFKRGDILDTNGNVLATSEKVYKLILDCKVVNAKDEYAEPTIAALVKFFDLSEADIQKVLTGEKTKNSQYQILSEEVTIEQKKEFEAYESPDEKTRKTLSEKELAARDNINGIWFEETYKRIYPMDSLACDVIGFTYDGTTADWGIEGYYGSVLNGTNGRQYGYITQDDTAEQTIVQPVDGSTVVSTIDANIQKIVEEKIAYLWKALSIGPYGTDGAANIGVVVENPKNGQILAMASSKPYDLNNPRDLSSFYTEEEISNMSEDDMLENLQGLWKNYCISTPYEPGSTFKPITVASALETGSVNEDSQFVCDGYQVYGDTTIKCSVYPGFHGEETLADALKNSCNDALMQIGDAIGGKTLLKYQKMFGFGSQTGIDLPGEASGITFTEESMGQTERASTAFGQGFTCTMIQEINAFSACINGGYLYKPTIVKEIQSSSGTVVKSTETTLLRQPVSSEVSDKVREYLGTVVESDGTGKYAKVNGYSMGGKTGTAQKMGSANKGKYLVSFIGFAPLDDPQVVVYVVVDEPNADYQGDSRYPQFLAKEIMSELLPYMNIFEDEPEQDLPAVKKVDDMVAYMYKLAEEAEQEELDALNGVTPDTTEGTTTGDGTETATDGTETTTDGTTATTDGTTTTTDGTDTATEGTEITETQRATAVQNEDLTKEAENDELAVPPEDTETVTGGQQLDDDGVTNDDADLLN